MRGQINLGDGWSIYWGFSWAWWFGERFCDLLREDPDHSWFRISPGISALRGGSAAMLSCHFPGGFKDSYLISHLEAMLLLCLAVLNHFYWFICVKYHFMVMVVPRGLNLYKKENRPRPPQKPGDLFLVEHNINNHIQDLIIFFIALGLPPWNDRVLVIK